MALTNINKKRHQIIINVKKLSNLFIMLSEKLLEHCSFSKIGLVFFFCMFLLCTFHTLVYPRKVIMTIQIKLII